MNALLHIGLVNALTAAALAVVAAAASKLLRRPPLTRALWVLVLLKLVTPPIWSVPVWHRSFPAALGGDNMAQPPSAVFDHRSKVFLEDSSTEIGDRGEIAASDGDWRPLQTPESDAPLLVANNFHWQSLVAHASTGLAILWLAGSVIYAGAVLLASLRIRQLIRHGATASLRVQRRAEALAHAMGLRHTPQVQFLDRPLPPMLCAIGTSPRILLPVSLWRRLDERQQDTVLAHELAHLRRRDHWVRALELLVSALYWWHPVVWWARRELREASEQCCDAWVVWTMPRLARHYAAALVEAIEYISSAPAAVPALASGMGQFTDLKRRLVMIKQGNVMRSLTRPALAAVCGAAGLLLPLSPSFGQSAPQAPNAPIAAAPVPPAAEEKPTIALAPTAPVAIEVAPVPQKITRDDDTADDPGGSDRAELQKARAEIRSLQAQLRTAERRLAQMERANTRAQERSPKPDRAAVPPKPEPQFGVRDGIVRPIPNYRASANDFSRSQDEAFARAGEKLRAAGQELNDARDRTRQTVERRLDQMERQLTNMVDQLRQMKRQLSDQPGDGPSPQKK